ncbi:hypothetical protein L1281_000280 [Neisseria sp. HSC-16F19]|nr:hypothetical protein [Neisseria sp. HSC-16F19]MCP2039710.1 hypothetical protein [Neisseria sp. HSC-16F19]
MKTVLKTLGLFTACLAAAPVWAQEYRVQEPLVSQVLEVRQNRFELQSVNPRGNLCHLDGRLQGQGSRRFYQDNEGCSVDFVFGGKGVQVSIDDAHRQACQQYCGHNAWMDGDYRRLPAACSHQAEQRMEARFQAAYRARRFNEAVAIKNGWFKQCESFAFLTTQMRARNDLAAAYKNAGNKTACRQVLEPLRAEMEGSADFEPTPLMAEDYARELKAARFNWQACH